MDTSWDMWGKQKMPNYESSEWICALLVHCLGWSYHDLWWARVEKACIKSSQFFRKVASHLALHQLKNGCKPYSLQYIYIYWLGCAKVVPRFWRGCCFMNHWQFRDVSQLVNINFHRILRGFTPRWDATPRRGGCKFLSAKFHCLFSMMTLFNSKASLPGFLFQGNLFTEHQEVQKITSTTKKGDVNFATTQIFKHICEMNHTNQILWDFRRWWDQRSVSVLQLINCE